MVSLVNAAEQRQQRTADGVAPAERLRYGGGHAAGGCGRAGHRGGGRARPRASCGGGGGDARPTVRRRHRRTPRRRTPPPPRPRACRPTGWSRWPCAATPLRRIALSSGGVSKPWTAGRSISSASATATACTSSATRQAGAGCSASPRRKRRTWRHRRRSSRRRASCGWASMAGAAQERTCG